VAAQAFTSMEHSRTFGAAARWRVAFVPVLLAAACAVGGCDETGDGIVLTAGAMCSTRVIVRFVAAPDGALIQNIERSNALELAPLGAISGDIRAYLLSTAGADADCRAAIERLRSDERVRSVEPDVHRGLPDDPSSKRGETR
jgi:hypothetical protein